MAELVEQILRRPRVQGATGHSRSSLYLQISEGLFTRPIKIGPRAVGWPASEVAAVNAARIAGKSDDDIRALVTQLEKARTTTHLLSDQSERACTTGEVGSAANHRV